MPRGSEAERALAEALLGAARPEAAAGALAGLLAEPALGVEATAPGAAALVRVLGAANFLARRPERLGESLREVCAAAALPPRETEAAHARLAGLDASGRLDGVSRELRRNRYAEMLRITARALSGVPADETTRELSDLADASIAAGLRAVEAAHDVRGSLVAIAMGKLGGRELNYSSDVDLLFAHGDDDTGEAHTTRLARAVRSLRSLLSETNEEGFVFRVDLDLRPEGRQGPLVGPADALVDFYESFGRTWERVAWIRARPCAGALAVGERIVAELVPFVYRRYGSYDVLQNVRDVKQRIEEDAHDAARNVKLGPGGIREAEFVVQALQSLYGGRHESLRQGHTGRALAALVELGILERDTARELAAAYALLRRVENGIQMAEDRQAQELPGDATGLRRLARRLGYDAADGEAAGRDLMRDLDTAREQVREAFASLLVEKQVRVGAPRPDALSWSRACAAPGALAAALVAEAPARVREAVEPAARRLAAALFPRGGPGEDLRRLAAWPDAAPPLALFLATDPDLVTHLLRRTWLVSAFGPADDAPSAAEATPPPVDGPEADPDDLEASLDALRLSRRDAFVRVAARRIRGELSEAELERALTAAAGGILERALALARHHAPGDARGPGHEPARLCVLGLGKLGSQEMSFHSDLDLVFLYEPRDGEDLEGQEWAARLAQKLIHYLTTPTSAGRAYEVDMRLRPSGHGGPLVASLEAFRHYHERRAQVWEAQALLRARPVAGDADFGAQVQKTVESALFEFLKYPDLREEVLRMRGRLENERARTGPDLIDLKYGAGGILDAEFLAQYLALREGPRRPELRGGATAAVIRAAGSAGLLRDAGDVLGSLETLRQVESSLRLVMGRATSTLELAGAAAPAVAELSGAGDLETLTESVRAAQERLRAVFARELGA